MTRLTTRLMVTAAAMAVAVGVASAQNMKAEIPFTFRANGVVMPAGTYRVDLRYDSASGPLMYLNSLDTANTALMKAIVPHDPPKAWRNAHQAVLSFECAGNQCSLVEAWGGGERSAFRFPAPRLSKTEQVRVSVVTLRAEKGD